jgi:L-2-hydroxyglutarate oxidase LhgO
MKELEIFENRYERLDNFSRVAPSRRNIPVKRHNAIVVKMDKAAQQFVTVCEMVMNEAQHFKTLKNFNDIFSEIMKRKKPKPANFHKLIEANLPAIDAINTKKDKIEKALQHMIVLLEEAEREMKKELS